MTNTHRKIPEYMGRSVSDGVLFTIEGGEKYVIDGCITEIGKL